MSSAFSVCSPQTRAPRRKRVSASRKIPVNATRVTAVKNNRHSPLSKDTTVIFPEQTLPRSFTHSLSPRAHLLQSSSPVCIFCLSHCCKDTHKPAARSAAHARSQWSLVPHAALRSRDASPAPVEEEHAILNTPHVCWRMSWSHHTNSRYLDMK